jgi:hypothetical protein
MLMAAVGFAFTGCTEKSGVQETSKVTGPEGTTRVIKDTKVESSGKNPPAPVGPSSTPKNL